MTPFGFTCLIALISSAIIYQIFVANPVRHEQQRAIEEARIEAEEKKRREEELEAIDKLLSDALSESSGGSHFAITD